MKFFIFILFLIYILPFTCGVLLSIYSFIENYYKYISLIIFIYFYTKYSKVRILCNFGFIYYTYYTFGYKFFETPQKPIHYAYISHPCGRTKQIAENKFHIWYDHNCLQNLFGN